MKTISISLKDLFVSGARPSKALKLMGVGLGCATSHVLFSPLAGSSCDPESFDAAGQNVRLDSFPTSLDVIV